MKNQNIELIKVILLALLGFFLTSIIIMLVWNLVMPTLGVTTINVFQALGIRTLGLLITAPGKKKEERKGSII
jgi:uncharacterized membrane protein YkgB